MILISFKEWFLENSNNHSYIDPDQYIYRMERAGFQTKQNGSHYQLYHPYTTLSTGFTRNSNWEQIWKLKRMDMRKSISELNNLGGRQIPTTILDFIWQNPFKIPDGYNPKTLSYDLTSSSNQDNQITIGPTIDVDSLEGKQIKIGNNWKVVSAAGYGNGAVEIMFDDGSVLPVRYGTKVEFK